MCYATVPGPIVQTILKSSTVALAELNFKKNFQGSAMAGALGGFNAHAANMVSAIYIATGQVSFGFWFGFFRPSTSLWGAYSHSVHPFSTMHPLSHAFSIVTWISKEKYEYCAWSFFEKRKKEKIIQVEVKGVAQ